MSISVSAGSKRRAEGGKGNVVTSFPEVPTLTPYKRGDKFVIPHSIYNGDDAIQSDVVKLLDSVQRTSFGEISWSMRTENSGSSRVVVVYMVLN